MLCPSLPCLANQAEADVPASPLLSCRSKDVIEPVLKPQWWVNCQQMAADACAAVRDGRLEIIPREFETTWFRWVLRGLAGRGGWALGSCW